MRAVCESVFREHCKIKAIRKRTVEAMKKMGEMYSEAGRKAEGGNRAPTLDDLQNVATKHQESRVREEEED